MHTPTQNRAWRLIERIGPPSSLFDISWFDAAITEFPGERLLVRLRPDSPAVVLGSSQNLDAVDRRVANDFGLTIVRRRSGGGAVWLDDELAWFDVVVPLGDTLADADVQRAFLWLGDLWAKVLRAHLPHCSVIEVHRGALGRNAVNKVICFAGLGPGEVIVNGRKVVGISQRRTRNYTLFQCGLLLGWNPAPLVELMRPALGAAGLGAGPSDLADLIRELRNVCTGLVDAALADAFADALLAEVRL